MVCGSVDWKKRIDGNSLPAKNNGYIALIEVQVQNNMKSEIFLDLYGVRPLTFSQICAIHPVHHERFRKSVLLEPVKVRFCLNYKIISRLLHLMFHWCIDDH